MSLPAGWFEYKTETGEVGTFQVADLIGLCYA
jgi:hypothetical protein